MPPLDEVTQQAIEAGDVAILRTLALTPLGNVSRQSIVAILDGLHAADALDAVIVQHAYTVDPYLGQAIAGLSPLDGSALPPAACLEAIRPYLDELMWQLTEPASPASWENLPRLPAPRGLRFVLRALAWQGDRRIAEHLGAAELFPAELEQLIGELSRRPIEDKERAFRLRRPAGDAAALLPLLGLASAGSLLRQVDQIEAAAIVRHDRAAIIAAAKEAGADPVRRLLDLAPSEIVSATLGHNRAAVLKRVKHNALAGIAAFGILPLADETVMDRYLALREIARRGPKLGPNRRHSHAAAVEAGLEHLAQVAGHPDASQLEWACEAQLAQETPPAWQTGTYRVAVVMDGADPVITVTNAGKTLKAAPVAVRADSRYATSREYQYLLRVQARRLRTGLLESLVATGRPLRPEELAQLRGLPAAAAMLPALLWRDHTGAIGWLDDIDTSGPIIAAHPWHLFRSGQLGHWQAQVVHRRLRQPVKQAFRELYLPTPAEQDAVDVSQRFAGHTVTGKVAGQLLSERGWRIHDAYSDHQATRPLSDGITAALRCDFHGYFGMNDVLIGELRFLCGTNTVPLTDVPPPAFSEVMRGLDLVVSVAGTDPDRRDSQPRTETRAQILAALIAEIGLRQVTIDGATAVVRGHRATYRVHLTSGSIHVEPGGYLCVVPVGFGVTPHRKLFLPFAEVDPMTSVILSKVLLLTEDHKISDGSILAQLDQLTRRA